MRRRLPIFLLVLTAVVTLAYGYVATSATDDPLWRLVLALPFMAIWLVPVLYWSRNRESRTIADQVLQGFAFVSMGWVSFALVLSLLRDAVRSVALVTGGEAVTSWLGVNGGPLVLLLATLAVVLGGLAAATGPKVKEVEVPLPDLPSALDGFRIVQISDLHVSSLIRRRYVERVTRLANELSPDLVALTGDIIDGPVRQLEPHAAPLAGLGPKGRVYFVTGNHEYYAGAAPWLAAFRKMGMTILQNSHVTIEHGGTRVLVAGVLDPAVRMVDPRAGADPAQAMARREGTPSAGGEQPPALKILLAHHPKLAVEAAKAGFDLQLSGHTHAGQFLPWTTVVRYVHAPHFAGLSREDKMWVYVSAGTGTWGPPVRLGTVAELTLIKLVRRPS